LINPQVEEDYIDFRTYPLPIDWSEIENEKSEAHCIYEEFGYFGVSLFSSFNKLNIFKSVTPKKFISKILESYLFYYYIFKQSKIPQNLNSLQNFVNSLPDLKLFREVVYKKLISKKELLIMNIRWD